MILVDTNVLLDVALRRERHYADSAAVLDAIERSEETMCVAWHSIATTVYYIDRETGAAQARAFIEELTKTAQVPATGSESLRTALNLQMEDLEDAMIVAAALACGAKYIVTRN